MSIKEVASIAGVSIATVSRFFNNPSQVSASTRSKVEQAIRESNYAPNTLAQNLRRGKSGIVICVAEHIHTSSQTQAIEHLCTYAEQNGYTLLIKQVSAPLPKLSDYVQMLRSKQADGFVIFTGKPECDIPYDKTLPIVLACKTDAENNTDAMPSVGIDDRQACQNATEYLIKQGHQHISFISNEDDHTLNTSYRYQGFKNALSEHGLDGLSNKPVDVSKSMLKKQISQLLESDSKPTALICTCDEIAIEALHHLKQLGINTPEDISVIGFNNNYLAQFSYPPLSSVETHQQDISQKSFDLLLHLMDEQKIPSTRFKIKHELIIRDSVATAPKL